MKYSTILFDIDGTLLDPGPSITDSARHALSRMGIQEDDYEALRRFVGPPLEHSFHDYYQFNEKQTKMAVEHFRQYLVDEGLRSYTVYPGVVECLAALVGAGATLGIVTSKVDHIARSVLKNADLADYFSVFCTQEEGKPVKKDEILTNALRQLNVSKQQLSDTVMVGDRVHDVAAAKTNGVDSIGILHGYGNSQEFHDAGATYVVHGMADLKDLLLG